MAGQTQSDFNGTQRFTILRKIGAGGMGVVYEALDKQTRTRVALKTLRTLSAESLLRFKNEFRALQDLHHPNLVELLELFEEAGQWFFTMELLSGTDLLSYVRGLIPSGSQPPSTISSSNVSPSAETLQPSPAQRVWAAALEPDGTKVDVLRLRHTLAQLGRGLDTLHRAGKIHRDIKPSNIRVTKDGRVVLLDFGLVANTARDDQWTDQHVVGTSFYMAPEQAASRVVGPEADWYSVGVLIYEALTGRLPFVGAPLEVLMDKQREEPPAPRTLTSGVPEDLDALCTELLRIDPQTRPSGRQILERLGGEVDEASPSGTSGVSHTAASPFIGRNQELGILETAFVESRSGGAITLLVHGESGVGKSMLVRRFTEGLTTAGDAVVLAGRCYERESVPYKAFDGVIDALTRFLKRSGPAAAGFLPRYAALLAQVFPVLRRVEAIAKAPRVQQDVLDPQELRTRVFSGLRELLGRLSDRGPVVVVIDDLQWADADSLALLREVTRPPEAPALLFVATVRTGEGQNLGGPEAAGWFLGDIRHIELGRLAHSEARELVTLLLERAAGTIHGDVSVDKIAEEARGHPLYIDELVRHTVEAGGGTEGSLKLDEALWSRVQRLDATAGRLLELIAVAGMPVLRETLDQAAQSDGVDLVRSLAQLRVANLVRTGGARGQDAFETYHDRVREAVLSHLDDAKRKECHARLAIALEGQVRSDPEALASHWRGAGDNDKAARYAALAGDQAVRAFAFERASRLYRLALGLAPPKGEAYRTLQTRLADALANAGRGQEAAEVYLEAAQGASAAEALYRQRRAAEELLRSGHITPGLAALKQVMVAAEMNLAPTSRRAVWRFITSRFRLRLRGFNFEERDPSQIAAKDLTRLDTCWAVTQGLGLVDTIQARHFQTLYLMLALKAGEPYRVSLGLSSEIVNTALYGQTKRRQTEASIERARRSAERVGRPMATGMAAGCEGIARYLLSEYRKARDLCQEAETIFRTRCTGGWWEIASMQAFYMWALYYLGDLKELTRRLPLQLREAIDRGDLYGAMHLRCGRLNAVWLIWDQPDEARKQLADAIREWPGENYYVQHYFALVAEAQIALYCGLPGVYERALREWPKLVRSFLMRVQTLRVEALYVRGRGALLDASLMPDKAPRLLAAALADAKRLERDNLDWARAAAALLRAGVAGIKGDRQQAAELCTKAEQGFTASDMALYAAAAKFRGGQLEGGDAGSRKWAEARDWMLDQGVKNPDRMTDMLLPGFSSITKR